MKNHAALKYSIVELLSYHEPDTIATDHTCELNMV